MGILPPRGGLMRRLQDSRAGQRKYFKMRTTSLLALLLSVMFTLPAAGCARQGAAPPGAASPGAGMGSAAGPEPAGADAAGAQKTQRWSPVTATMHLADDPGVRSGFVPAVAPRPLNVVIRFSGPVDRVTTQQAILQGLRGAASATAAEPRVEWQDDTEALLRVPDVEARPGAFLEIGIDGARDRDGLPIRSPGLTIAPVQGRATVWRVPADGQGSAEKVLDVYEPLIPLAAAPGGDRIYLARVAHYATESDLGIPYVYETASGRLVAGTDAVDLSGPVELDPASGDALFHGTSLFSRFTPDGRVLHDQKGVFNSLRGSGLIVAPRVSRDGQRLAALLLQSEGDDSADLLIYDIAKRKLATYFDIARPHNHDPETGTRHFGLEWSPDGRKLLFDSRAEGGKDAPVECFILDVASDQKVRLATGCRVGWWSPAGDRIWLAGAGVISASGRPILAARDGAQGERWSRQGARWSPDGSRLLLGNAILDVATAREVRLTPPAEAAGPALPLGWSADGRSVFIGYSTIGPRSAAGTTLP